MSDSSLSSSELLLSNLSDHQVIRIEGSFQWMEYLTDQVKQAQPDTFEVNGSLALDLLQNSLAEFLHVEAGASFIQQELKRWLQQGRRLHIIVNSNDVSSEALTYLLGLPSICDETGPAVTIILLSTPEIVSALKSSSLLASKLDGYYQEEVDSSPVSRGGNKPLIAIGALTVVCLSAGGWYWFDSQKDSSAPVALVNSAEDSSFKVDNAAITPSSQSEETVAENQLDTKTTKPVILEEKAEFIAELNANKAEPEPAVVKSPEPVVIDKKLNPELVASLTATVEKAKQKRDKTSESSIDQVKKAQVQEPTKVVESVTATDVAKVAATEQKKVTLPKSVVTAGQPKVDSSLPSSEAQAEPVTEFVVKLGPKENNEKAVREVFTTWHTAWEKQDWDDYINSYLQNTTLYGVKMSLEEWREFRKNRLLSPQWIKLEIKSPKYTRLNSHWYRVEFYQRFEKPGYADETNKRLELTLTSAGWKIASEAANGTVVLKRPKP
ncbi:hypothetical protein ACMXYN_04320 [Neptuniibacter sp. PT8_73]|uniref:L,D-transpeptidase Cds6 family protein n=1 Tax=Neptuniibacter sp. PT8_73 TaxID=3398206 RepID=UPI0039F5F13C